MRFEWDPDKAERNLRKHGVSFDEAASVFYDPLAMSGQDPDHSEEEERFVTFGISSSDRPLVISHTFRTNAIRIISARPMTPKERRGYEQEND